MAECGTTLAAPRPVDWIERAAVGASFLCLVHCLALPLALSMLPALAGVVPVSESVHVWILGFALPAAGVALFSGWAQHRAVWPFALGGAGLALMALGAFGPPAWETPVTVLGSGMLASAHIANWRLRHRGHAH